MRALLAGLLLAASPAWAGGFVRIDAQRQSEARLGLFAPVSRTVAIAPSVRLSGRQAELDVGVTAEIGALYVTGWVGGGMRWEATQAFFGPGLALAFEAPPIPLYLESWTELRLFRPLGGLEDELWKQDLVLITVRNNLSTGAQFEPRYTFPGGLQTLYVGPRVNLGFGKDALGLFGGWDTQGNGFTARVTLLLRF
ncbi:MAG: hypothetical protein H6737_11925 [Alphaproteobacteria bacterium]|nr:hypothetical protein [Alphaproteobacteria bacterium]